MKAIEPPADTEKSAAWLMAVFESHGMLDHLSFMTAQNHEKRLFHLERILDRIYGDIAGARQVTHVESEDQLSLRVVGALKAGGIQASHGTQFGGHVDILVTARDGFTWIAEAKLDNGKAWLRKGYLQLVTRYVTGAPGADMGELIIYCRKKDARRTLLAWQSAILNLDERCKVTPGDKDSASFQSTHISEVSGRPIRIRHCVVPLYFYPQDRV